MKKTILFSLLLFISSAYAQQTFYGTGGPVPDLVTVQYPMTVSGLPTSINSTFGLENVCINISHTYVSDITITIQSPDGNVFLLSNRRGGGGDNYTGTCFRGGGVNGPIGQGYAPFTGTYIPDVNLATVNNGQNPNGTWWIIVTDYAAPDTGNVNSWSITFGNNPTPPNAAPPIPCSVSSAVSCWCPDSISTDCDLLPDMISSSMVIDMYHTEYGGANPRITLANATPNIGSGPIEIHGSNQCYCDTVQVPCTTTQCPDMSFPTQLLDQIIYHKSPSSSTLTTWIHPGGTMSYHPTHGHIHVDNWAWFTLRHAMPNPDARTWPIYGTGSKTSFCLINLGNCTNSYGYCIDHGDTLTLADITNAPFGQWTGCGTIQGIFTGSLDVYGESLNGMGIVLPVTTCNGDYYIVSITDPDNNFLESNEDNNWVAVPITLTLQANNSPWPTPGMSYVANGHVYDFINTSADFDSVYWDFGDGNTIMTTADTTTHTYLADGIYIVTLIAYNPCGPRFIQDTLNIITTGVNTPSEAPFNISAYPNPFNNSTRIKYYLAAESEITLEVFNSIGQRMETLFSGKQLPGKYEFDFGGDADTDNGVYYIRLTSPSDVSTLRLVKIR